MIHVIARLTVKADQFEPFIARFKALVPEVLAEPGCIAYGPTLDVDSKLDIQEPLTANVLTVIEQWESVEALHTHLETPHVKKFFDEVGSILESAKLFVTEPV